MLQPEYSPEALLSTFLPIPISTEKYNEHPKTVTYWRPNTGYPYTSQGSGEGWQDEIQWLVILAPIVPRVRALQ